MSLSSEQLAKLRIGQRLLEKATEIAARLDKKHKTYAIGNSVDTIRLHCGWAGKHATDELIATGNWNAVDRYDAELKQRVDVEDTAKRVGDMLERLGFELEWSDMTSTCDDCGKLIRTEPDCYSWTPSYVIGDGCITCDGCLDPEDHLESLEGNPDRSNTIKSIDPAKYGYFLFQNNLVSGLHQGQDASPQKVGAALEKRGVTRYLFQLDGLGQFDAKWSVWVHESERDDDGLLPLAPEETQGPSNSARAEKFLKEASAALRKSST